MDARPAQLPPCCSASALQSALQHGSLAAAWLMLFRLQGPLHAAMPSPPCPPCLQEARGSQLVKQRGSVGAAGASAAGDHAETVCEDKLREIGLQGVDEEGGRGFGWHVAAGKASRHKWRQWNQRSCQAGFRPAAATLLPTTRACMKEALQLPYKAWPKQSMETRKGGLPLEVSRGAASEQGQRADWRGSVALGGTAARRAPLNSSMPSWEASLATDVSSPCAMSARAPAGARVGGSRMVRRLGAV